MLGLLNQDQVEAELARCTTLVLPSGQETSPMVIAEAMAAGVPVVATDVGGVTSLLADGVTGLVVPPAEPKLLAEAIEHLVNQPDLRAELGTKAREVASERFRSSQVAARVLDVYRMAVGGDI
jgi:glycosyltransferase involved in cell wall biosynthesis